MSTAAQAIEEYKDFDTFEIDTTIAAKGAYVIRFDDYKKVTEVYPTLELHCITSSREEKDTVEEEEGESAEQ